MKNYKYLIKKEQARQEAIFWQLRIAGNIIYYEELIEWQEYFRKRGKRYGLLKEFKENGII